MGKFSEQAAEVVQVTLFDDLLDQLQTSGTSADIAEVIEKLKKAKTNAQKREKEGRRRKKELEALRKRQAQEEHIRQVTSMDLPMDWENLFAGDSRAEGVQRKFIENCQADSEFVAANFALHDKDTRRQIRKTIFDAVAGNELATTETHLMQYQGFEVILPSKMTKEKPFLWLQRLGRYYVELGDTEKGYLIRLDNVLEGLPNHQKKLENKLLEMQQRQIALGVELQKKEDYTDKIAACKEKLARLDKKLGVDKV